MSDDCKTRLKERNTSGSWFSSDGSALPISPPDTANSPAERQADDQAGPSTHATPTLTASVRKFSFSTVHDPAGDSDESDWSSDTSSEDDDVETTIDATGRLLWDCAQLTQLIQRDTVCHGKKLVLKESADKRKGWCSDMTISCEDSTRY